MASFPGMGGPPPIIDPEYAAESNATKLMAVITLFQLLSLITVVLRVYCRVVLVKSPGIDDLVMVLGLLFTLGGGWGTLLAMAFHGLGKHDITVQGADLLIFDQANFWLTILALLVGLGLVKVSIGLNLLRLSTSKWYKWSLRATIAFVIAYTFMACMTMFLHCDTVAGNWDYSQATGCYSIDLFVKFGTINTAFNIFTDVLFAVFPVPIIWTLQMKRKLRIYLVGIMSLGYFAVAVGIVKAYYQINFTLETDIKFTMHVQFWGFIQLNVGIIAACAPSLKPLFTRILGLGSTQDHYYNSSGMAGYGSRYGRGTRRLEDGDDTNNRNTRRTATGSHIKGPADSDEFELEEQPTSPTEKRRTTHTHIKGMSAGGSSPVSTTTTAGTFYKNSGDGSGSEEMILGVNMNAPTQAHAHAVAMGPGSGSDGIQSGSGRNAGILKTTEVQVVVK